MNEPSDRSHHLSSTPYRLNTARQLVNPPNIFELAQDPVVQEKLCWWLEGF